MFEIAAVQRALGYAARPMEPSIATRPSSDGAIRRRACLALALLVPVPLIGVASEMTWFPGPVGLSILALGKLWIFALPLWWTRRVERAPLHGLRPTSAGLGLGLVSGVIGSAAVIAGYHLGLKHWIDPSALRGMAAANGLDSKPVFLAVAVYICVLNSLLEEYVWRWFVYRQCEVLAPRWVAVPLAAAGFTVHHTWILSTQFGPRIAVVGSLAVFVAGVAWSWLFARTRSLGSGWASHFLIDVAVFVVGYRILFGA